MKNEQKRMEELLHPIRLINRITSKNLSEIVLSRKEMFFMTQNYAYILHSNLKLSIPAERYVVMTVDNCTLILMSDKGHLIEFTDKIKTTVKANLFNEVFRQDCVRI